MEIKLIIFDWDDVFTLGSKEGYFACYHETLNELGIYLDPNEEKKRILAKWGQDHREELKELLKEHPSLLDQACVLYEKKLFSNTFVDRLTLVAGAREMLIRLHKQYTLCVATGLHPKLFKEVIIPKFSIPNVFSEVISAYDIDDPKKQKPSPFIALNILEKYSIPPEEALVVGDAPNDMLMAQAAHITPIAVLTGHMQQVDATALGVLYVIEDVTKLESVLQKLNQ